ncbi:MAG: NADH-quinone oxidoreductase subunit C [Chloroflexi bacterium]|nr:NADH-quinone oxidoreductase subunit C [Chloroflexota bacterium]
MTEQDKPVSEPEESAPEGATDETAQAEAPASVRPARRAPPHEEEAPPEVLNPRGQTTLGLLMQVADPYVIAHGGRDDIPWIETRAQRLTEVARRCRDHRDLDLKMLHCLLVVDYIEHLQAVYVLLSPVKGTRAILKVNVPADEPKVPSLTGLWAATDWYEREMHELFGMEFEGHPNLSPLILYEGFEGYPGLKSFPFNDYEEF